MNIASLLEEAHALARPCAHLAPTSGQPAGWWGGDSNEPSLPSGFRHWLTVNSAVLPEPSRRDRFLSLFSDGSRGIAVFRATPPSAAGTTAATPLAAHVATCLPPIDALFRYGSPRVHEWLRSLRWDPEWGYNNNLRNPDAAAYERAFQAQHPLYSEHSWALAGGWHLPWPDDDWLERMSDTLLLTTFHDAEPWFEVFLTKTGNLLPISRIT